MKRLVIVALLLIGVSPFAYEQELKTVATLLNERLAGGTRRQVAVVDFTDLQGCTTELGRFLAEELSVALTTQAKGFVVIDRTHLKAILQEHKLASSGVIDPQTARQLGKIAGVDALVTGTVTPFGDSVRLSVKTLDTQTAAMLAATTADVPKTKAVEELLAKSVVQTSPTDCAGTGPAAAAAPPAAGTQRVSAGGLTFELERCRAGSPVTCELSVISPSKDVDLSAYCFGSCSRAFDASGNELRLRRFMVANREGRGRLVANVRIPLTATFADDSGGTASATQGTMLSLVEFEIDAGSYFRVQFRNVPLK